MPNIKTKFDSNDILMAEFERISKTASEANDDRGRIAWFINLLFTLSSVSIGFLITDSSPTNASVNNQVEKEIYFILFFLFMLLTMVSTISLAQLARLRLIWNQSVRAIEKIKDFYIEKDPEITRAFMYRKKSIPPLFKTRGIDNLIAAETSLFGGVSCAASIYFLFYALNNGINTLGLIFAFLSFPICNLVQWRFYKILLLDDDK